MYRFLVVGLGGSGGRTLQYMVDQMLTDLRKRGWTRDTLPACWQFVHIDVPANPDGVESGLPDPITVKNRGRYIGIGSSYDSYRLMDSTVMNRLLQTNRLRDAAVWRPDPDEASQIPIHLGAGQYRGVGRIATLSRAQDILDGLTRSAQDMYGPQAASDLEWLHRAFNRPPDGVMDARPIVVSSIAGGSGASMVLDVCNLIRAVNVQGFDGRPMAFIYTPDVFERLPASARGGVEANALGAISELMSAQASTETSWSPDAWRIYGTTQSPAPEAGRGAASIDLVGARNALTGALFGDGQTNTIYRGLGRSLAAMVLSPDAQVDVLAHRVGNFMQRATSGKDKSELGGVDGVSSGAVAFDAIGFASIGLGRDRFAEYSAQRLARSALDRLVRTADAHLTPAEAAAAVRQHAQEGLRELDATVGWDTTHPLELFWPTSDRRALVASVFPATGHANNAPNQTGAVWHDQLMGLFSTASRRVDGLVESRTLSVADGFALRLQSRVEQGALLVASRHGLAVAAEVLEDVNRRVGELVAGLRRDSTRSMDSLVTDAFNDLGAVSGGKGTIAPALVDRVTGKLHEALLGRVWVRILSPAADVLAALTTDIVLPLRDAFREVERDLTDLTTQADRTASSSIETLNVSAWPIGEEVPSRFATGVNEVLIEPIDGYAIRYRDLMAATFEQGESDPQQAGVSEVITGLRRGPFGRAEAVAGLEERVRVARVGDEAVVELDAVGRQGTWSPAALVAMAVRSQEMRTSSKPAYRLKLQAADLVAAARLWITRPGSYRFSEFIRMGLADYIAAADRRVAQDFSGQFARALELAAPLVGVEPAMLRGVHEIDSVQIRYSFTPVPLTEGEAEPIRDYLRGQRGIDDESIKAFDKALSSDRSVAQIDVIGNYARPFSPVVFSSLQAPISSAWSGAVQSNRLGPFWQWRRGRTLTEFLPVSPAWQQALVKGWLTGRLTGELTLPGEGEGTRAAQVWSVERRAWLPFLEQAVPRAAAQSAVFGWEWAAAILETMPVAVAVCSNDPTLSALRPYQLLRDLGRPAHLTATAGPAADQGAVATWLDTGRSRADRPSMVKALAAPDVAGGSKDVRFEAALTWISQVHDRFAAQLPSVPGRPGGTGEFATLTLHNIGAYPREMELAELFVTAADRLTEELNGLRRTTADVDF